MTKSLVKLNSIFGKIIKERTFQVFLCCVCLGIAVIYSFILLQSEFGALDDLIILQRSRDQSISEIFSTSFLPGNKRFYRPLIILITKIVGDFMNLPLIGFRLLQISLVILLILLMMNVFKKLHIQPIACIIGCLYFIGSEFTFELLYQWCDIGSLIIVICFLLTLQSMIPQHENQQISILTFISIIVLSLLSKELGIIIPLLYIIYFYLKKQNLNIILIVTIFAAYFIVRANVLGSSIPISSKHYVSYANNILSQFMCLITSYPRDTVFHSISISAIFTDIQIPIYSFSSLIILMYLCSWKENKTIKWILIISVLLNVIISYSYCRTRVLAIAGTSYAILLSISVDRYLYHRHSKGNKTWHAKYSNLIIIALLLGWFRMASLSILELHHTKQTYFYYYINNPVPDSRVNTELYQTIRSRSLNVWAVENGFTPNSESKCNFNICGSRSKKEN